MQLLSIKLVRLFFKLFLTDYSRLSSALYEKFSEMLVLSSNSDNHPDQKFSILYFNVFGISTTINLHYNREVFWIHFSSQED